MLSNPTNNLQTRQRQHRRQNSTPNAFESVKVSNLPNIQRHGAHRRGMSLDTRRRQSPPQDLNTVSNTNQGYQTTQQHILRETQQQRLARPGQQFTTFDNDENYLNSPIVTPHRQSFDASCTNQYGQRPASQYDYNGPVNTIINVDPNNFPGGNDFALFQSDGNMTPSAFLDFSAAMENEYIVQSENSSKRSSRRISGGIVDRVAQFESLALKSPSRPITPPNQNVQSKSLYKYRFFFSLLTLPGYFPPTPVDTPYDRMVKHEQTNQRFLQNYDTSMEETIKPKSNQRARGVFDDMRKEVEMHSEPSPPGSGNMPSSSTFDSAPMPTGNFLNMSNLNLEYMKHEDGSNYSPVSSQLSYHSSPETANMNLFGDPFVNQPVLEAGMYPEPPAHGLPNMNSPMQSDYRRSESVSSINIEETITETGITIDDIATFISGPDPVDGRWLCLYPECKKKFGRKENIKSHVQTHLGDRQFQCPHCRKCFVRQHDLKRHAKIHSGVKPYPCQCGNSFARHDALTRHRQRGMCIGAFEGVIKKSVKRGRPRKNRPDSEERASKASRTRSKNKAMSSASSTSCSESNDGHSPRSDLDDILDDKPFGDYEYTQTSAVESSFSQAHSPAGPSDYVSPQAIQTAHSPSAFSTHSTFRSHRNSVTSISDHLPSHPASPAKSVHSQYSHHSPPGLCESSSSPAPSHHYYDLDATSNNGDEFKDDFKGMGLANISEHDDEMFLEAFAAQQGNVGLNDSMNGMTTLERSPELLLGNMKFDDTFGAGEEVFQEGEDVFFGSP
jgi:regulatory protein SWI5